MTPDQLLQSALAHLQAGNLPHAEALCRQVLAQNPNHVGALHILGLVAFHAKNFPAAIQLLRHVVTANPNVPEAHYNLAHVLKASGDPQSALQHFHQCLVLNPNSSDAYINIGILLKDLGRLDESAAAYREALTKWPNNPELHVNLAVTLMAQNRPQDAIPPLRQALALRPNFPEASLNLGLALRLTRQFDQAVAAFQQAITLRPDFTEALTLLAQTYRDTGRHAQALPAVRRAADLQPFNPEAHLNLANTLHELGQLDQALASYNRAIALKPDYVQAINDMGLALKDAGQLDESLATYRRALAQCTGPNQRFAKDIHSNICYAMLFHPGFSPADILAEHRSWNDRHAVPLAPKNPSWPNTPDPHRRLKIGYISPDFRSHVVGWNLLPLFRHHDRSRFEIFCYANLRAPDNFTREFQKYSDHFLLTSNLSDDQVAAQIRHDQIDILVDLALHMSDNNLLVMARKPAPVQITFAGYPGTTGLQAIDYRLTDPHLDPPDSSLVPRPSGSAARSSTTSDAPVTEHYSERSLRLPHSFWCYDPPSLAAIDSAPPPEVSPLPALANRFITFGCLNNFCKVNEQVLALWAQILRALPDSRLHLLSPRGPHRDRTLRILHEYNIQPARITLLDALPRTAYLQLYHHIDIGLDTFPYNGHTTSLDSLFMGVPVITLIGPTVVGRAGFSQLSNLNLPDLAAHTPEQFVQITLDLANNLPRLSQLRAALRPRMQSSPLTNAPEFARSIESAYRQIWRSWCTNRPTQSKIDN